MKLTIIIILLHFAHILAVQKCQKDIYKTKFRNENSETNVVVLWFPIEAGIQKTLNVCSYSTGLPLQRYCHYDRNSRKGKWQIIESNELMVNCSNINSKCKEEPFDHYISKNGIVTKNTNIWKEVNIMETSHLHELCLLNTGLTPTRKCSYNSSLLKAEWETLGSELKNVTCIGDTREEVITFKLNTLNQDLIENKEDFENNSKDAIKEMLTLLARPNTIRLPADIKLSTEILETITEENKNENMVSEVLNITNMMMNTSTEILHKSDTSSVYLKTIDRYFDGVAKKMVPTIYCQSSSDSPNGVYRKSYQFASLFFINPSCSNISGIAIYNSENLSSFEKHYYYDTNTKHYYRFLYLNQSIEGLLVENHLRLATFFPLSLWNNLTEETFAVNNETVLKFLVFQNDRLFTNQGVADRKPTKKVLEISIPDYHDNLPGELPIIFNNSLNHNIPLTKPVCGYWNYKTWAETGIKTFYINNANHELLLCYTTHLTHFSALMGIELKPHLSLVDTTILHVLDDSALDYISIAGCGLSLFGLICIWLTAMFFKSWRSQPSNKVLLNMCFVLTLIMAFFLLLNFPDMRNSLFDMKNTIHCMIIGGFLQYNVLVLFTWMLIIAIMQYQRYVQVFGIKRPTQFIIKFSVIAWGMPLIPTCLVAYLDPESYMPSEAKIRDNSAICYPSGNSLYYGVLLPMAIVITANLGIFVKVFWSLHHSLKQYERQRDRKNIIKQIRLSVLLFFLLGISWIFGMLAYLDNSPVFSYIFCLTSTLQGFVLFIYFIVIDETTRYAWLTFCCAKSYNTNEDKLYLRMVSGNSIDIKY